MPNSIFTQAFGKCLLVTSATMIRVHDVTRGRIVKAKDIVGDNAYDAFILRKKINDHRRNSPLYLCPECNQSLILRMKKDQSGFYFSHEFKSQDCPIKEDTQENRKNINRRKYKKINESNLHCCLKTMLESCLQADTEFSNVRKERWWKGEDGLGYRRPDIQADYKTNTHIAFEIQLSTTYADDIADRMDFARRNNGILIWVAHKIDMKNIQTAVMDTLYANNSNFFIFNDEMYNKSLDLNKLHLECVWLEPETDKQYYPIRNKVVTLDDLQFNLDKQWVYYFDFESSKNKVNEINKNDALNSYKNCNVDISHWNPYIQDNEIVTFLGEYYIPNIMTPYKAKAAINSVLSAIYGKPQGWKFNHNQQVFHLLYQQYPELIVCFCFLEKMYYNGLDVITKVHSKKTKIYRDLKQNPATSKFVPSTIYDDILHSMFPEEFTQWQQFRNKYKI